MLVYGLKNRPISIGTIPNETKPLGIEDIGIKGYYGFITSDTLLSEKDVCNYDLVFLSPTIWRNEMLEINNDPIKLFKDKKVMRRYKDLREKMEEYYYKKIVNDKNLKHGLMIKGSRFIHTLTKGYEKKYRITTFTSDYEALSHKEYNNLQEFIKMIMLEFNNKEIVLI